MQVADQTFGPFICRPSEHAISQRQAMTHDADEAWIVREKVRRGLEDVAAGRVLTGDVVEAKCEALFG
ncbi:hypothetical protein PHO31112_00339 [Pandoraea horticolens]|uniref:Uncharacterized protein n=1 Tax=Pandoraea horticolens TaxID=2508298 RepID=A0A5E4RUA2_9BURK|nr:hypothetical protein [Pandoraea horticolens]VVD65579.1 hypothetical protein PHO31112_00339 [Pandoraea horticolens]